LAAIGGLSELTNNEYVGVNLVRSGSRLWAAVALVLAFVLAFAGVGPAQATHLRGAVGTIVYDSGFKTVTVTSTMVERKEACYYPSTSSSLGGAQPTGSLCTFFGFPTITAVDHLTGVTKSTVTKCPGQATTPQSWVYDSTSEPLYNIFTTTFVIDVSCPNFNPAFDFVFSQTGSNRIGGIRNTTNQVIQFQGRVNFNGSHITPMYNAGYMTNVAYIDPAVDPNYIFSTNLNALDSSGRAVAYSLVTSSAAALDGYGASKIPCSDLNATTGEFRVGYKLCSTGENFVTSFSGGTAALPVYWALKTRATDGEGQYVTRDVLLSFAGAGDNHAPTISNDTGSGTITVPTGAIRDILFTGLDSDTADLLTLSTNTLPTWAVFTLTAPGKTTTPKTGTLHIDATGITSAAFTVQVSVTDSAAFSLSATSSLSIMVGDGLLPPGSPGQPTLTGNGSSSTISADFTEPSTGGAPSYYVLVATPVSGGASLTSQQCAAPSRTCSISGLSPSTLYTVVVRAFNAAGSADSTPSVVTQPILAISPSSVTIAQGSSMGSNLYALSNLVPSVPITSYSATGLPTGLSINSLTGTISGTPGSATAGSYSVTITGFSATGQSTSVNLTVVVSALGYGAQTLTFPLVGRIPYQSAIPTASTGLKALYAYSTSGLPVSFGLSASGTQVGATSADGTSVQAAAAVSQGSASSNFQCTLIVFSATILHIVRYSPFRPETLLTRRQLR